MKLQPGNRPLKKQLHAEIRRILQLLERSRRARRRVRLLMALETRALRRKMGMRARGARFSGGALGARRTSVRRPAG